MHYGRYFGLFGLLIVGTVGSEIAADPVSGTIVRDSNSIPSNVYAEIVPQAVRIVGIDLEGERHARAGEYVACTLYAEMLPYWSDLVERPLILHLSGIDVARVDIDFNRLDAGTVVTWPLSFYVPRSVTPGKYYLGVGFAMMNAPGDSRASTLATQLFEVASIVVEAERPVEDLVAGEDVAQALQAWGNLKLNLVRNGGFEDALDHWVGARRAKADWHWPGVSIQVDETVAAEGRHSLRIDFTGGRDTNFEAVFQRVPLEKGKKYRLQYLVKCDEVTSDRGVGVEVMSLTSKGRESIGATPAAQRAIGSTPWTAVSFDLEAPLVNGECHLYIQRHGASSRRSENSPLSPIGGSVWLDGIAIVER